VSAATELEQEVALSLRGRLRGAAVGIGRALRPAVPPLAKGVAYGGAAVAGLYALSHTAQSIGQAFHPPAQPLPIDTDPSRPGPESYGIFDPLTGRLVTFGAPPADKGLPDRTVKDLGTWLILGAAAVLVVVALTRPGGK
jgi:hypothetical protein